MALSKIRLAVISTNKTNADSALASFVNIHCFAPVDAIKFVDVVHGLSALSDENPCPAYLGEIAEIEKKFSFLAEPKIVKTSTMGIIKAKKAIDKIKTELSDLVNKRNEKKKELDKYEEAYKQVKTLAGLNTPLEDIFSCDYVYARFGKLPNDSVEKLEFYQDKPFIFKSFAEDKNYSWCMYFTSKEYEREVDNIFSSLFFERFYIPDFVHGTPKQAAMTLADKKGKIAKELEEIETKITNALATASEELSEVKGELQFLNRVNAAKKYVVVLGSKISISGFVRSKDVHRITEMIKSNPKLGLEIMPADADARLIPPKILKKENFY